MSSLIHQLFESQADQQPGRVAAIAGREELSYQLLDQRSNQFAHYLQNLGVGPETLVGIHMEPSLERLVAVFAVLKAGGAYVPFDPGYPKHRLAFMLDDAAVTVMLTETRLRDALPLDTRTAICVDADRTAIDQMPTTRPVSSLVPENLAYILYTSGSTGKPKGVQISHAAVTNMLFSMREQLGLTADDRGLAVASLSFDMSVFDLFLPLSTGASVVIADRDSAGDPNRLLALLEQNSATYLHATPATWRLLINSGWQCDRNFGIFCGGDALPADLAKQLLHRSDRFWNLYGPTETTVYSATHRLTPNDDRILIGSPIANTGLRIMNDLQPADRGQTGELHIGGAGLSRGYLKRPDLTAERFVPDPFSDTPGARLYRTGDVARVTNKGSIELLGRIDHQVKVRGFRIELGEIETVLAQHPAVKECVVLARSDHSGDSSLVAYLITQDKNNPAVDDLQSWLHERLPEYMVPAAFVFLDVLPLTANGKVDRLALSARERVRPNVDTSFVAPRTATEMALQEIWKQTLDLDQVGINDNFFQLGGHSLIATRVVSQVREQFDIELPIRDMFASPTIGQLGALIDSAKNQGLQLLLPRIPAASRAGELPLSFPQERVWFIEQLFPQNLAYNFQSTLRLKGALDVDMLERSLTEIVRRHEIYRTTFPSVDGHPVQVIHDSFSVSLPVIDVTSLPESEREAEAKRQIDREIRQPFSLTQLPLIRWVLIRIDAEDHILVHIEHHLVHDGWSFNVFLNELIKLYTAFASGQAPQLPELPIQFADFAQWQRRWLSGEVAEKQLRYWRNKLQGSPPVLELPADRPRPAVQSFRGTSFRIELPLELCESLRAASRQHSVTLFMMLFGIFQILLERYTNQQEFVVGSGIANRRWPETETMIGMLVNTVALRADTSGDPAISELLHRVRETTIEAYANQDLPFELVVDSLQGQRDLSRNPLFQVMFNFHDASLVELKLPGLSLDLVEVVSNGSAKFDLNVIVIPRSEQQVGSGSRRAAEGITVIWEYNTDLFDASTIRKMADCYQLLLEQVAGNSERRISSLHLTSEAERAQLLHWNETGTAYPEKSIAELFEEQAEQQGTAVAVVCDGEELSYAELNRRANQLAHYLRAQGVGPETLVGICLERSLELAVGLLGILKAGGAYLPLDANYPAERLAYMLADARPSLLLTQSKFLSQLPRTDVKVICLNAYRELIEDESSDNPGGETALENLAYVMYTSGSTGYPKGVAVTQRNVVRLVKENNYASLTKREVFLQFAPLTFDASTLELWGALLNGARLVIFPPYAPTLEELGRTITEQKVSTLWLTAGLFHQLVDERPESLSGVRQLLAGGDVLSVLHVEKALQFMNGKRLINGYGPTENTTFTCCHQIKRSDTRSIPIGRPLANTQVYVLDRNYQPVPVGVVGELYVGGDGLARGYMRRPELTAEKFIPHLFSEKPGGRLYSTGDLVRYLPSGELEFIRRVDQQVKIRGFRLELGEIEAVLAQHRAVAECVVTATVDKAGEKFLAAYVVATGGEQLEAAELRSYLRAKLPEYMVPSSFVFLEALPLTANGKVNRQALPAAGHASAQEGERFVGPRTVTEKALSEIWARALHLEQVGVTENFFELGGNSLTATRVMSRVRARLNVELPLRALFESPTIAEFAQVIEKAEKSNNYQNVPAILPVSRTLSRVVTDPLDAPVIPKS